LPGDAALVLESRPLLARSAGGGDPPIEVLFGGGGDQLFLLQHLQQNRGHRGEVIGRRYFTVASSELRENVRRLRRGDQSRRESPPQLVDLRSQVDHPRIIRPVDRRGVLISLDRLS